MRYHQKLVLGVFAFLTAFSSAWAQQYPDRPIKWIVPYPPAGTTDVLARIVAQPLSEILGQQVIVENRPGAGNNIGTEAVIKAAPDGYTMLLVNPANGINATLYKNLPFNFIRDIAPVAGIVRTPNVMVVEEYEHAKARGAKIYAEICGYGMSADAGHMTAPSMDGPRRAMVSAMRNAGINADQVGYLNAHGTSTPLGDLNETNAIKAALGDHAKKTLISSTKSMTGHLLGGAGGIESIFTVLALHHQKVTPTINLDNQDPECDLDYCANTARDVNIEYALKNNFGFGGTNGSLVFRRI